MHGFDAIHQVSVHGMHLISCLFHVRLMNVNLNVRHFVFIRLMCVCICHVELIAGCTSRFS